MDYCCYAIYTGKFDRLIESLGFPSLGSLASLAFMEDTSVIFLDNDRELGGPNHRL